jgi:catechol 2,3-dioxygenase-like lactoylglutathione lyase family enzyme
MYDHMTIRVKDMAKSRRFYEKALAPLGLTVQSADDEGAGFGTADGIGFWIALGTPVTNAVHIAFTSPNRAAVKQFHVAAMEAGGKDNGAPGLRAAYAPTYYAAFVYDPDGNNIEAVCHKRD